MKFTKNELVFIHYRRHLHKAIIISGHRVKDGYGLRAAEYQVLLMPKDAPQMMVTIKDDGSIHPLPLWVSVDSELRILRSLLQKTDDTRSENKYNHISSMMGKIEEKLGKIKQYYDALGTDLPKTIADAEQQFECLKTGGPQKQAEEVKKQVAKTDGQKSFFGKIGDLVKNKFIGRLLNFRKGRPVSGCMASSSTITLPKRFRRVGPL